MGVIPYLIEPMTTDCATILTKHPRDRNNCPEALTWCVPVQWAGIVGNTLIDVLKVPLNALDVLLMQQVPRDFILACLETSEPHNDFRQTDMLNSSLTILTSRPFVVGRLCAARS